MTGFVEDEMLWESELRRGVWPTLVTSFMLANTLFITKDVTNVQNILSKHETLCNRNSTFLATNKSQRQSEVVAIYLRQRKRYPITKTTYPKYNVDFRWFKVALLGMATSMWRSGNWKTMPRRRTYWKEDKQGKVQATTARRVLRRIYSASNVINYPFRY